LTATKSGVFYKCCSIELQRFADKFIAAITGLYAMSKQKTGKPSKPGATTIKPAAAPASGKPKAKKGR
jgi:hypothetical protein